MQKRSIKDVDIAGKTVFVRVDFNVPIKDGKIEDDTRIRAALPTIKYVLDHGGSAVLASHLGRPLKDKKKAEEKGIPFDESKYSLRPVAEHVSELLGHPVSFRSIDGDLSMLENLRLDAGEEENDPEFAKKLAVGIDVYVNDAFGTAHRAHASTEGITHHVDTCVAGLLMEKELEFLGKALHSPERPFVAILGGAKVSDKIPVIKSLIARKVDKLLIGGAMAYTFFKANGYTVGKSLVEDDMMETALDVQRQAEQAGVQLILPTDHQVVDSYDPINSRKAIPIAFTNAGLVGLDIGPETAAVFAGALEGAKTIVWNGPMGMFEEKPFNEGTLAVAMAVAAATEKGAVSIVGGGDSVSAVNQAGLADKISHISTGGGATLEFLAGDALPGVEALDDK
ncbi:MAG: phosphoglycerate kinase [Pyrinomonadaceae bacterium]|nr:phosphoglycerate kinase [Pyrinomonadaceae bacterium]